MCVHDVSGQPAITMHILPKPCAVRSAGTRLQVDQATARWRNKYGKKRNKHRSSNKMSKTFLKRRLMTRMGLRAVQGHRDVGNEGVDRYIDANERLAVILGAPGGDLVSGEHAIADQLRQADSSLIITTIDDLVSMHYSTGHLGAAQPLILAWEDTKGSIRFIVRF